MTFTKQNFAENEMVLERAKDLLIDDEEDPKETLETLMYEFQHISRPRLQRQIAKAQRIAISLERLWEALI